MAHEFSEAARKARFEQWDEVGADRVKSDLERDPYRLIGSGDVQALAWEWVRMKEAEQQMRERDQEAAQALGRLYPRSSDWGAQPLPEKPREVAPLGRRAAEQRAELFTLKPSIYGVGFDLKEALRRIRRLFKKSPSKA